MITTVFLHFILYSTLAHSLEGAYCVQTYNAYATAYAPNVEERVQRAAQDLVHDPKCDLVGVQELWKNEQYSDFSNILKKAGYESYRPDNQRGDKKMTGIAAYSLRPFTESESKLYELNNADGILDGAREMLGVEKGFSISETETASGKILLVNTHTHPTSQHIRVAQMIQLIDYIWGREKATQYPLVLTADLNAGPEHLELNMLKDLLLLRDTYKEAKDSGKRPCTYCGDNPLSWRRGKDFVFDYVLVRNGLENAVVVQDTKVNMKGGNDGALSDHFGYRAILTFKKNKPLFARTSSIVIARVKRAKATLGRTLKGLKEKNDSDFEPAIKAATAMLKDLDKKDWPSELDTLFRAP